MNRYKFRRNTIVVWVYSDLRANQIVSDLSAAMDRGTRALRDALYMMKRNGMINQYNVEVKA